MNCFKPRKRIILERIHRLTKQQENLVDSPNYSSAEFMCYSRAINRMWRLYAKNTQNSQR